MKHSNRQWTELKISIAGRLCNTIAAIKSIVVITFRLICVNQFFLFQQHGFVLVFLAKLW